MSSRFNAEMRRQIISYLVAFSAISLVTYLCLLSWGRLGVVAVTLFLLIIVCSANWANGPCALIAALVSGFAWWYFFLPSPSLSTPFITELLVLATFVLVGIITAILTSSARYQAEKAEGREREMTMLYRLSMAVLSETMLEGALRMLEEQVSRLCGGARCRFWVRQPQGNLRAAVGEEALDESHRAGANEAMSRGEVVDTTGGPPPEALYVPLIVDADRLGVMTVESPASLVDPSRVTLLQMLANHGALALQRNALQTAAGEALGQLEAERLKASLLASVSHDLRTPLASIKAAASGMAMDDVKADDATRIASIQSIIANADRLDRLVGNLLNMSRLEAGAWQPSKEFFPFSEILVTVLGRLSESEAARVTVHMAEDLPLVPLDGQQIEQVLWNLFENALKYSPPQSRLDLTVKLKGQRVQVSLRDNGSGIPKGEERRIFQKFYRAHRGGERGAPGVGMGLAICKEIVEAHDGEIHAENAVDGGAVFVFTLPIAADPVEQIIVERKLNVV